MSLLVTSRNSRSSALPFTLSSSRGALCFWKKARYSGYPTAIFIFCFGDRSACRITLTTQRSSSVTLPPFRRASRRRAARSPSCDSSLARREAGAASPASLEASEGGYPPGVPGYPPGGSGWGYPPGRRWASGVAGGERFAWERLRCTIGPMAEREHMRAGCAFAMTNSESSCAQSS